MGTRQLINARAVKNDEFYTLATDVENGLSPYLSTLHDKKIHCPCDPHYSAFVRVLQRWYRRGLLLHKPTHASIEEGVPFNSLKGRQCVAGCDVVITNPPFSRLREFLSTAEALQRDFIVVVPITALSNVHRISRIAKGHWHVSPTGFRNFKTPHNIIKQVPCVWCSTMRVESALPVHYSQRTSPHNATLYTPLKYTSRGCSKLSRGTPCEVIDNVYDIYTGASHVLAVPVTYLTKHNPSQFVILGIAYFLQHEKVTYQRVCIQDVRYHVPTKNNCEVLF